ncbi:MAG TPA: hypothetical protein VNJ51_12240 [Candidatus Dormibacteraeota bacterium]|nr:hypothetical protein [Candidatus Dormibacteraeota bacterium]
MRAMKVGALGVLLAAMIAGSHAMTARGATAPAGPTLPAGPALKAVQTNCQICHSIDMVTTQRLSKATWEVEVTKMMKFGSPLPKADKETVVAYLAKYLAPGVPRYPVAQATAPPITHTSADH